MALGGVEPPHGASKAAALSTELQGPATREVAEGTRTPDHRDHNPGLYQLSYCHRAGDIVSAATAARRHAGQAGATSRRRAEPSLNRPERPPLFGTCRALTPPCPERTWRQRTSTCPGRTASTPRVDGSSVDVWLDERLPVTGDVPRVESAAPRELTD